ncbi:hypothetical protein [Microvirga lenta]|uniref:hypothetical protein n=1 Tax=Microvirga lenta TaxID=2881337 RepID=UPI001CFF86E0|nr:hypothetical protein [Microvirga lenta]MCB5176052.1 hypothetical protein [Microvirga lenta]
MRSNQDNPLHSGKQSAGRKGFLSETDLKILWVARTLTNIDLQYESDLLKLNQSRVPHDLKKPIQAVILSRHHARREPYVKLLEQLQGQQRHQTIAA